MNNKIAIATILLFIFLLIGYRELKAKVPKDSSGNYSGSLSPISEGEFFSLATQAGFNSLEANNFLKIAQCESSLIPSAYSSSVVEESKGLLQINLKAHPEYKGYDLFDPATNLRIAREIFENEGYKAWYNCAIKTGVL